MKNIIEKHENLVCYLLIAIDFPGHPFTDYRKTDFIQYPHFCLVGAQNFYTKGFMYLLYAFILDTRNGYCRNINPNAS